MDIVYKKISDLAEYPNNPRVNDEAVEKVKRSIEEFGFKVPMVVDSKGVIIAGHTRLKASKELGLDEVPCIIADDLTEAQAKAFRLADNKTNEFARWDYDMLSKELKDLNMEDFSMSDFGFVDFTIDFEPFDGDGDGGGSQIGNGTKLRIVIGACILDLEDIPSEIYMKTKELDKEHVREVMTDLLTKGELF